MALSNPVGPKSAQVTETQEILTCSRPGHLYAIDVDTVNGGIPYAESFYVQVHYCLTRRGDHLTHLQVIGNINYKKSVWGLVKSFIEKNAWAGLDDYFNCLLKCLQNEVEDQRGPHKSKIRRRRRPMGPESSATMGNLSGSNVAMASSLGASSSVRLGVRPANERVNEYASSCSGLHLLLAALLALFLLNGVLYWRLWALNQTDGQDTPTWTKTPAINAPSPEQIAEWSHILKQQSSFHLGELDKWRTALNDAISLLKQTENALANLQLAIKPTLDKTHATTNSEL